MRSAIERKCGCKCQKKKIISQARVAKLMEKKKTKKEMNA